MNILMVTNVFTPQIGGVTRSVEQFCEEFRNQGHRVLVMAPEYEQTPPDERDVIRVPSIPNFYQEQYSLPLPVFSALLPQVREFAPEIVHVHHPFLLGSTGQMLAAALNAPLVYTHHTRYSVYIETKTSIPRSIEEGIVELIVGFCELCDGVVVPSAGIEELLQDRGVTARMRVIPTGVDVDRFAQADRSALRQRLSLPEESLIVGHVGRLSPEKNTPFLARAVAAYMAEVPHAHFVVVGDGPARQGMEEILQQAGVADRGHFLSFLQGSDLIDAYAGFDIFAFASHSETQGMVLTEAMAAGVPVVGVDATGIRDLIIDGFNGRLIPQDDIAAFTSGLKSITSHEKQPADWRRDAVTSAADFSQSICAAKMLEFYAELIAHPRGSSSTEWQRLQQVWEANWQLWRIRGQAVAAAARNALNSSGSDPLPPGD